MNLSQYCFSAAKTKHKFPISSPNLWGIILIIEENYNLLRYQSPFRSNRINDLIWDFWKEDGVKWSLPHYWQANRKTKNIVRGWCVLCVPVGPNCHYEMIDFTLSYPLQIVIFNSVFNPLWTKFLLSSFFGT